MTDTRLIPIAADPPETLETVTPAPAPAAILPVAAVAARADMLAALRRQAIRATHPEDWLLFRAPADQGGQVVAYLAESGCERIRDLWGIDVYDVTIQKTATADPAVYCYVATGNGYALETRQTVAGVTGARSSVDDFARQAHPAIRDYRVQQAARANMAGNIVRELTGLKAVPIAELRAAWIDLPKQVDACRRGRGFGPARSSTPAAPARPNPPARSASPPRPTPARPAPDDNDRPLTADDIFGKPPID